MPEKIPNRTEPRRDDIARKAYSLWESAGRPAGRDLEYWLQAEALLRQGRTPSIAAAKPDSRFAASGGIRPQA